MTTPDQSEGDRSRDQLLAGEYVLGVLSPEARKRIEERMARDKVFAAIVRRWQANLAAGNDLYDERRMVRRRIQTELGLFASKRSSAWEFAAAGGWWNSLFFWRGVSFVLAAGIVTYAALQSGWIGTP
jgi:anti-sigma-K factor RskA